jgi:hypothetical protein
VLDVYHQIDVVEQHPAAAALALAAYRLGLLRQFQQPLLDRVDDRLYLAFVGRGGDQERVGDHQLVGDVDDDDVVGLLVGGGLCGGQGQLDSALGCGHRSPSLGVAVPLPASHRMSGAASSDNCR